ncbi:pentapeptide repeat-containing protein [Streptomyces sp. NPDC058989]|uniref:pentapeptide repeat-containing protein n=1 Tax=Streptomyces sp. NPDC058989 TaxID=3346686 RepID=UPI0036B20140
MQTRTYGSRTVTLPGLDEPGVYLSTLSTLEAPRGVLQDFRYGDSSLRDLDLTDTKLVTGRIHGLTAARARFDELRLNSVDFDHADLGMLQWTGSKLSRVSFRNCKLMGAQFDGLALDDVLFENCKLDYATFTQVRATGSVVFSKCSLAEVVFEGCDLSQAVIDDCVLRATEFSRGRYQGFDLRGNDLSTIRGAANLSKIVIGHAQQPGLADALISELDVTFKEDMARH